MRRVNPKAENKPRGDDFSPTTKRLAEDLRTDFVVKMVEQHAFMDDDTAHTVVDGLVEKKTKGAEEGSKTERRGKRYEWEEEYRKDLRNAVSVSVILERIADRELLCRSRTLRRHSGATSWRQQSR